MSAAASTWETTITIAQIVERLRAAKVVNLFTHSRPDGDAVGSTLALARALLKVGVDATVVYAGPWTHHFDKIVRDTPMKRIGDARQLPPKGGEPDLIIITDTGSWSQLREIDSYLRERAGKICVIDHHLHGDVDISECRHIDTSAAAVCETIAEVCRLLLGLESCSELPAELAHPLYLGLATDTGWFRHSNVTARTLRLAADFLAAGADHAMLFAEIEQRDRPQRILLMGRALSSLELHADNRAAIMVVARKDFDETGAVSEDSGGFSDMPLTIGAVRVCVLITELEPGLIKLSLRSKPPVNGDRFVDVNEIARTLGGGGHAQAAGAKLEAPLTDVHRRVVESLVEQFR